jgi:hypothetical protein
VPSDTPPTANDDTYSIQEDNQLSVPAPGVLDNDTDTDGDPLTASLVGTAPDGLVLNADGSLTYDPLPDFYGDVTFQYVANDGSSDSNMATVTITVNPVSDPPTANAGGPYSGDEGTSIPMSGAIASDPDILDMLTYTWSVDSTLCSFDDASLLNPSLTCTDNGNFTATLEVSDGVNPPVTSAAAVAVDNVVPIAVFSNNGPIDEGSDINLSLTSPFDPSPEDSAAGFQYAFDCGAGYGAFSATSTAACPTNDNGTRTVKGIIQDRDGGFTEYTADVTTNNVAPTATFTNASGNVIQGESAILEFSNPLDPGADDTAAGFLYSYDCTDDGTFEASDVSSPSFSCPYPEIGDYTARGLIKDKDGGMTEYTVVVTVLTAQDTITLIGEDVQQLVTNGILTQKQGDDLQKDLDKAFDQLEKGKPDKAIKELEAFIAQVNNLIVTGVLTPEEGQPLIDAANELIDALRA